MIAGDKPRRRPRITPLAVLVGAQILAILGLAVAIAAGATIWDPVDEKAHVAFVQKVAEGHNLPILKVDCVSPELRNLQPSPPRPIAERPCGHFLGSASYEAFQPPLYYVAAAPLFAIVPGYRAKVYALRAFDVALLVAAMVALWWLVSEVFSARRLPAFALGLCALGLPGVLVRQVPVSNAALELPLALAFAAAAWRADARPSERRPALLAAVLLALCLLTKLTLIYLIVPFAVILLRRLLVRRHRSALVDVALCGLIPLLLLTPWFIDNERRYHALTPNAAARQMQLPYTNPLLAKYTWKDVPDRNRALVTGYLPQECSVARAAGPGEPLRDPVAYLLLALIVGGPLLLRRGLRGRGSLLLFLPLGLAVLTLDLTYVWAQQDALYPRYLNPALPMLAVGLALVLWRGRHRTAIVGGVAASLTAVLVVLWTSTVLPEDLACTSRTVLVQAPASLAEHLT